MRIWPMALITLTAMIVILIGYLTLTKVDVPPALAGSDKWHHTIAFTALAFPISALRPKWLWLAAPAFITFGGAIEIIQPYVGRDRDILDWLADIVGVILGCAVGCAIHSLRSKRRSN
jgi:membrane associated rhomboid family serine protease